jgi:nucleoside-diphosphate-sugar epimerase
MKIFLTGGTGFVGTHFLRQALAADHEVVALRRPGSRTRLELPRQPYWIDGELDGEHGAALQGCEVLVHLASHTPNPPYDTLERCLYWNVWASIRLAEQARAAGVSRFLIAGSCFEYGRSAARYEAIPNDAPLEPELSYPVSKAAASVAFLALGRQSGVRLELARIFQVYGEGEQATRLWPSLRRAALAGEDFPMSAGGQWRDFVAVEDVAAHFVRALPCEHLQPGEPRVTHVASGRPQRLIDFAEHWWRHWGATGRLLPGALPYRPGELMRLLPQATD